MTDPMVAAARAIVKEIAGDMRASIEGAAPESLNWRPAGDDTNAIAVLAIHSMHSTRSWLSVAIGAPLPDRDRPSEFMATADDVASLLAFFDAMTAECDALLAHSGTIDWATMRKTHARPAPGAPEAVPAGWALLHAIEHLREHTGQMSLTRQLWSARA